MKILRRKVRATFQEFSPECGTFFIQVQPKGRTLRGLRQNFVQSATKCWQQVHSYKFNNTLHISVFDLPKASQSLLSTGYGAQVFCHCDCPWQEQYYFHFGWYQLPYVETGDDLIPTVKGIVQVHH